MENSLSYLSYLNNPASLPVLRQFLCKTPIAVIADKNEWHFKVTPPCIFLQRIWNVYHQCIVAAQWNTSQHFLLPSPSSTLPSLPGNDLLANVPLQEVATPLFSGLHPPGNNFGSLYQVLLWAALVRQGATPFILHPIRAVEIAPKMAEICQHSVSGL